MMRQAALQCLRSRKTPKSKPFWIANTNTIITSKPTNLIMSNPSPSNVDGSVRKLCPQTHTRRFCTTTVSSPKGFTVVTRAGPELVGPARPTPRELKPLSATDNWEIIRFLTPTVRVYRYNDSMQGVDPARVVRDALARALVFYYPLAGRLREGPDGRLSVDCTGEGVVFAEADADVELERLGDPPVSCLDEFMLDIPSSGGIIDSPLIYIQVTRLKCGGFVLGLCYNHAITDAAGLTQFLTAAGEIARGANSPSVTPVWSRHIFDAPPHHDPLHHHEQKAEPTAFSAAAASRDPDKIHRSLFFTPSSLSSIRNLVPDHLRPHCTTFETLTAYLWRCRVAASRLYPEKAACLSFAVSTRANIPKGYYGNSAESAMIETTARELCERPMEYAIGLVKRAKEDVFKKMAGPRGVSSQPRLSPEKSYLMVSDTRRFGARATDFGWGESVYAGPGRVVGEVATNYVPYRNRNGEEGVLVLFCLPSKVMERFESEVKNILLHES